MKTTLLQIVPGGGVGVTLECCGRFVVRSGGLGEGTMWIRKGTDSARHGSMCGGLCTVGRSGTNGEDLGRRSPATPLSWGSCAGTKAEGVGFRITLASLDELASDESAGKGCRHSVARGDDPAQGRQLSQQ